MTSVLRVLLSLERGLPVALDAERPVVTHVDLAYGPVAVRGRSGGRAEIGRPVPVLGHPTPLGSDTGETSRRSSCVSRCQEATEAGAVQRQAM